MKKLYRRIVAWLMSTSFYEYVLRHIIPYIRFSMYYTTLRGFAYHELYDQLQPGDVILSYDKKKLTTLLIPGQFSHASMCVSLDNIWEVSEMTHTDYTKSTFFDICKESDRVVIMRCINSTPDVVDGAVERCKGFVGAEYDFEFKLGVKALYCSELVHQSYANNFLEANLEDVAGIGREYVSPTGLYKAKNLVVVADSNTYTFAT